MKDVMFGLLDVHLERWDSSYRLTWDKAGTYQHISRFYAVNVRITGSPTIGYLLVP